MFTICSVAYKGNACMSDTAREQSDVYLSRWLPTPNVTCRHLVPQLQNLRVHLHTCVAGCRVFKKNQKQGSALISHCVCPEKVAVGRSCAFIHNGRLKYKHKLQLSLCFAPGSERPFHNSQKIKSLKLIKFFNSIYILK